MPSILLGVVAGHLARGIWGVICGAFCRGQLPSTGLFGGVICRASYLGGDLRSILPGVIAEHGVLWRGDLPSILFEE